MRGISYIYYKIICLAVLVMCLSGCNLADDDDLCCNLSVMTYKLTHNGQDYFSEKIEHMECYLFSADDGSFIGKLYPSGREPNKVDLSGLPQGEYEMIAVANLEDYGELDLESRAIDGFRFSASQYFRDTPALANGDHLYWGTCRFCMLDGGENGFETELSNLHCSLKIKVEWEMLPPGPGDYYLQLSGVYGGYDLSPGNCRLHIGDKVFPCPEGEKRHVVVDERLLNMTLQTEFITLRYTNEDIPSIRLWHGDTAVTELIDLKAVFSSWGWKPDLSTVQEYELRMFIKRNGTVVFYPGLRADVNDWVNGGTFG